MILLGTSNDGAYLFDSQNGLFTKINGIDPEVRCFFKDKDRGLLVGTHNGVYVINNNMSAYPIYEINEVLPDKYITSILNDNSGNILIATFGKGIVVFNKENRPICHLLKKTDYRQIASTLFLWIPKGISGWLPVKVLQK